MGLKYTGTNLHIFQDKDLILTKENNIRGGISGVLGDRQVKSDENKKILFVDTTNFYAHSMNHLLSFDEIEMWHGHPDLFQ